MVVTSEDFIVMSFALWAGDYEYLETLIKNASVDSEKQEIPKNTPESIILSIGTENLEEYKNKREKFSKEKIVMNNNFLETVHIRARIWQISDFEYSMRAYLKNFKDLERLFDNFKQQRLGNARFEKLCDSSIDDFYGSWNFREWNNCVIRIDEMGLIDVSLIICESDEFERILKVMNVFFQVLESFNDGPVKSS